MFDINQCYDSFATEPNSAYFWSGLGNKGEAIAADIASENGGVTLELLMSEHKDELIQAGFEYDKELDRFLFSDSNYSDWEVISQAYAEQANGDIHVVLGENVREDSVWTKKEFPSLCENNNVTKITAVDPKTGHNKDVLFDRFAESQNNCNTSSSTNVLAGTSPDKEVPFERDNFGVQSNSIEQDIKNNLSSQKTASSFGMT